MDPFKAFTTKESLKLVLWSRTFPYFFYVFCQSTHKVTQILSACLFVSVSQSVCMSESFFPSVSVSRSKCAVVLLSVYPFFLSVFMYLYLSFFNFVCISFFLSCLCLSFFLPLFASFFHSVCLSRERNEYTFV